MMTPTLSRDEQVLDYSLKTLLADHGCQRVLDHLVRVARSAPPETGVWMPGVEYLLTLTPEERAPFLAAAVEDALPLYEADSARPPAERELTADLETSDFYEYGAESERQGTMTGLRQSAKEFAAGKWLTPEELDAELRAQRS